MEKRVFVWGKVKRGNNRGKHLGFPTANILLHKDIPEGVYVAKVEINRRRFQALTFVGAARTFGESQKMVESYILNFKQNIYGQWIVISLFKKLRGNIKFKSEKELIAQMKKDLIAAKNFYANSK